MKYMIQNTVPGFGLVINKTFGENKIQISIYFWKRALRIEL